MACTALIRSLKASFSGALLVLGSAASDASAALRLAGTFGVNLGCSTTNRDLACKHRLAVRAAMRSAETWKKQSFDQSWPVPELSILTLRPPLPPGTGGSWLPLASAVPSAGGAARRGLLRPPGTIHQYCKPYNTLLSTHQAKWYVAMQLTCTIR